MATIDFKAKAIEVSIGYIAAAILGAIGAALLWLFSDIPSVILKLFGILPNTVLTKLSLGLFVVCLLEGVWIYILRKRSQTKLKPCFGILWNKDTDPFCPSCKTLLTNYSNRGSSNDPSWGFKCIKCDTVISLKTDNNQKIDLQMAKSWVAQGVFHIKNYQKPPDYFA